MCTWIVHTNPAAAAVRAADALEDACQELLASLVRLAAHPVSAEQLTALDMLRQEITRPRKHRTRWPWPTWRMRWRNGLPAATAPTANG